METHRNLNKVEAVKEEKPVSAKNAHTDVIVQGSEESVEEASDNYARELYDNQIVEHFHSHFIPFAETITHHFIAGANWQKQQRNDEVVAIIEAEISELNKEDLVTKNAYDKATISLQRNTLTNLLTTITKTS